MKQIDRLLMKVKSIGKSSPVFGIFNNLNARQLRKEEKILKQQNPDREVIVINIVPAKKRRHKLRT